MEGWDEKYSSWQDAITTGSLEWSFTADKLREIIAEFDILLGYPEPTIRTWLPKICSGLPTGSPDHQLSSTEFIVQVKELLSHMADDWERNGRPQRAEASR